MMTGHDSPDNDSGGVRMAKRVATWTRTWTGMGSIPKHRKFIVLKMLSVY